MAGTETHGYDLAIEFAEQACRDIVSAFFDSDGVLSDLLNGIGAPSGVADAFTVVLGFDRPSGVPASNPDVVDIQVLLGEGATGSLGHLRIVAGIDVEPTAALDVVQIDLANRLHRTELEITGLPGPANTALNVLFRNALRDTIRTIPLVPIPVDRGSTSPTTIIAGDARVVDDTTAADADAAAFLLTFGGGAAGNRNAFTRSFLAAGDTGGIAISFDWLCRVISPLIDASLDLDGAFTNCGLTRTVRIDDDKEVDLTALSLSLDTDFIRVAATVRKTGFCYEATGTVAARIRMEVVGGELLVSAEVENPDVDVDIPWYCWLAGAVIGAIVAGVIGAVLVPLIIYIAQEVVEGTINSVAARVAEAINSLNISATLPVPGVNLVFQRVFIDDVTVGCDVAVSDHVPVRSEGIIRLGSGMAVDLDSGRVGPLDLPSADVICVGRLFGRQLRATCGARLARTDLHRTDGLMRSTLYGFAYTAPNPVPVDELAQLNPWGMLFGDPYEESRRVYAVHTNEGRYAVVQAIEVEHDTITLRYRTWEKRVPTLEIQGEFRCEQGPRVRPNDVRFVPSAALASVAGRAGQHPLHDATDTGTGAAPDPCAPLTGVVRSMLPPALVEEEALRAIPFAERRIGRWVGVGAIRSYGVGRFDAITQGFGSDLKVWWSINDTALVEPEGDISLPGAGLHYQVNGKRLVVTPRAEKEVEFLLTATAVDQAGLTLTVRRCVRYQPICKTLDVRDTPKWTEYQTAWLTNFGVVNVPVAQHGRDLHS